MQNINKNPGNVKHHKFKKEGRKCRTCKNSQEQVVQVFSPSCAPPAHTRHTSSMQAAERGFSASSRSNQSPQNSGRHAGKADLKFQHHGDWFAGPRAPRGLAASNFRRCSVVPQASHLPSHTIPPRLTTTTSRGWFTLQRARTNNMQQGRGPLSCRSSGWGCMHLMS